MLMVEAQIRCSMRIRPGARNLASRLPPHRRRRPQRAHHQHAPRRKPDEESDLPEAAELDIGEALVSKPEPALVDDPPDAEVIADQIRPRQSAASPRTAD